MISRNQNGGKGRNLSRPIPDRIREAREARGFTSEGFAERLEVTKQTIAQYENGLIAPSGDAMKKIIAETQQPPGFFITERTRSANGIAPFWRSLKRMESHHRKRITRRIEWASDLVEFIGNYIKLPDVKLPHIVFDPSSNDIEQIEAAARAVRECWELGTGPIRDLSAIMELNGIILVRENVYCPDMDAVSCWQGGRPYVLYSSEVESGPRNTFNLAHELGHVIAHATVELNATNIKLIEMQANRFASAFLLPQKTFSREILGTSINHFLFLKERWGVSIAAMIYRCKDLGIFTPHQYQYLVKQMRAQGMTKREPLDDKFQTRPPSILGESLKMLIEHDVQTRAQIEESLSLNMTDIESLCGLSNGYLDKKVISFTPRMANDN